MHFVSNGTPKALPPVLAVYDVIKEENNITLISQVENQNISSSTYHNTTDLLEQTLRSQDKVITEVCSPIKIGPSYEFKNFGLAPIFGPESSTSVLSKCHQGSTKRVPLVRASLSLANVCRVAKNQFRVGYGTNFSQKWVKSKDKMLIFFNFLKLTQQVFRKLGSSKISRS